MVKYLKFVKRRRQSDIDIFVYNSTQTLLIWVLPKYIDCTLIYMNFYFDSIHRKSICTRKSVEICIFLRNGLHFMATGSIFISAIIDGPPWSEQTYTYLLIQ